MFNILFRFCSSNTPTIHFNRHMCIPVCSDSYLVSQSCGRGTVEKHIIMQIQVWIKCWIKFARDVRIMMGVLGPHMQEENCHVDIKLDMSRIKLKSNVDLNFDIQN